MDTWNCPRCNRLSLLADGTNGRPTRDALPTARDGFDVYWCAPCNKAFEAVELPAPEGTGEYKSRPDLDDEGLLIGTDGSKRAIKKGE